MSAPLLVYDEEIHGEVSGGISDWINPEGCSQEIGAAIILTAAGTVEN